MKNAPKKTKAKPETEQSAAEKPTPKAKPPQSANDSLRSLLRGSYVHKMCG